MDNVFSGAPYSSVIIANIIGTKGNLAGCFHSFLQVSKGAFCRRSSIWIGRNGRLKPGKLLNLIKDIGNETRQFSILLL